MAGEIGHWCGIGFIGGGLGTVDKIDGAALQDKEGFLVITPTMFAPFSLDVNSGAGENSPQIIAPNTNPGDKRWILTGGVFAGLTSYGNAEIIKESADAILTLSCYHNTEATTPALVLRKADNTAAAPALIDNNAVLGTIRFDGYDGSGWHTGAKIEARIQGTPSDGTDMPTEITFWTCPEESATLLERLIIDRDGNVEVIGASGDGVSPVTLKIHTITDGSWTAGKEFARLDFVSNDTSGDWEIGETRARIAAIVENTTGTYTGLAFYTSSSDAVLREQVTIARNGNVDIIIGNLQVGGVQVVSDQGAAVADATDAPSVILRLNELLARCRTHGLIAT